MKLYQQDLRILPTQAGLLLFAISLALYIVTLAPTYLWSDSAKLALYVHERNFAGTDYGIHPIHNILGYVFSFLPFSLEYSQNFMSSFFAAGALYVLFALVRDETGDLFAAALASMALAVSQLFWLYAVINETYSLVAFLQVLVLYLSLKWVKEKRDSLLYAIALLTGMGFANHGIALLFVPGVLVLLWDVKLLKFAASHKIGLVLIAFVVGASPVTVLPLLDGIPITTLLSKWAGATTETYETYAGTFAKLMRELIRYPLYLLYQFPTVGALLGVYGLVAGWRDGSRLVVSTFVIWLTILLFASQYFVQRQFPMLIPSFVVFAIWIGVGLSRLSEKYPMMKAGRLVGALVVLLCLLPPLAYYGAYRVTEAVNYDLSFVRALPYRNTYRYYLFPPKHMETGAKAYVEDSFKQAKTGAIILTDFNPGMALLYGQKVLGNRKDLRILVPIDDWVHYSKDPSREVLDFLRRHVNERNEAVYLADNWEAYYHVSEIKKEFFLKQAGGPLWEVSKMDR